MKSNFVNLHVHTAVGSLLDSIAKIPDIVKFAVDNNQPAKIGRASCRERV